MELTRATQFALRTVVDLAVNGPGRTHAIASKRGIPPAQASKLVGILMRAGIVLTSRGAGGGIRLARSPETITLREIVEAVEGPIIVARCVKWDDCPCIQPCPVRAALARVQRTVEDTLGAVRIADLAEDERRRDARAPAPSPTPDTLTAVRTQQITQEG